MATASLTILHSCVCCNDKPNASDCRLHSLHTITLPAKLLLSWAFPSLAIVKPALRRHWKMEPELPFIDPRHPALGLPEPPPWRRDEIVETRSAPHVLIKPVRKEFRRERRYHQPLPPWMRWIGYGAAAVLLLVVLGSFVRFVLPAATVTLILGRDSISITFPLTANPTLNEPDLERNTLPARLIETTVEGSGVISTTGTQEQATLKAKGQVVFSNLSSDPVFIQEGTVVSTGTRTDGRSFAPQPRPGGRGRRNKSICQYRSTRTGESRGMRVLVRLPILTAWLRFRLRVTNPNGIFWWWSPSLSAR